MAQQHETSKIRELGLNRKYAGTEINRIEPTAHEFRSRKHAMVFSIMVVLYVLAGAELQAGTYGIIKINNVQILEATFYIAFVWSIYRFSVICFGNTDAFFKKAIEIVGQHIHLNYRGSWIDIDDRYMENISKMSDKMKDYINSKLGSIPDINSKHDEIHFTYSLHTYSGGGLPISDYANGGSIYINASRMKYPVNEKEQQIGSVHVNRLEIQRVLLRAYKILVCCDDSFSEWIAPWVLVFAAFICLYYRLFITILHAI